MAGGRMNSVNPARGDSAASRYLFTTMKKLLLSVLLGAALLHGLRVYITHSRLSQEIACHRAAALTITE